ncbi:uncharacterized protein LOC144097490 [Amblyomma americanum]
MSSESSSSPSNASSRLDVSTELGGGPRVEVSAVRTGSRQDQQGGASASVDQTPGVRTSISQARIDYGVCPAPRGASIAPNSFYAPYDPYNHYSPYNPYNPYILCSPCCVPCTTYCHQAPVVASAPQGPAVSVTLGSAVDGTASTAPGPARLPELESREKRIIIKNGFEVVEEYVNDRLVSRTVNRVPASTSRQ